MSSGIDFSRDSAPPDKRAAPPISMNSWSDVVQCLKNGDCVGLLNEGKVEQVFHNCMHAYTPFRFIYVELGSVPKALIRSPHGWQWKIQEQGFQHCMCQQAQKLATLQGTSCDCREMPQRYSFDLMPSKQK